jgi:hypothetical protein
VGAHRVRLRLTALSLTAGAAFAVVYLAARWFLRFAPAGPRLDRTTGTLLAIIAAIAAATPLARWLGRVRRRSTAHGLVVTRVRGKPAFVALDCPNLDNVLIYGTWLGSAYIDLFPPNDRPVSLAWVAALAAALLVWATDLIAVGPRLKFTATALRMPWYGWRVAIPWDKLTVLAPDPAHDPPGTIAIHWRTVSPGWHRIRTGSLLADRDLLYRAIQHYIAHPNTRAAIGTQQELDRLRSPSPK